MGRLKLLCIDLLLIALASVAALLLRDNLEFSVARQISIRINGSTYGRCDR